MNISSKIIEYYHKNKRDLVWRKTKNPYFIWISEIMLQQTRVEQVNSYFIRFSARFPDVFSLADADENEVLKYWQGLGYYSRARNLHLSAKYIVNELQGVFPDTYADIIQLKGVGDYTAAAIASIAFGEKVVAVDGNVYRVLARIFNHFLPTDTSIGKKSFKKLALSMLDHHHPADFNQAMMEFGATICKPLKPLCDFCPVTELCEAKNKGNVLKLPVKKKMLKVLNRYFQYLVVHYKDKILMQKRNGKDIWKSLYEFPLIETSENIPVEIFLASNHFQDMIGVNTEILEISDQIKHRLSHQLLHIRFYKISVSEFADLKDYEKVKLNEIDKFAVPKVIETYIKEKLIYEHS